MIRLKRKNIRRRKHIEKKELQREIEDEILEGDLIQNTSSQEVKNSGKF